MQTCCLHCQKGSREKGVCMCQTAHSKIFKIAKQMKTSNQDSIGENSILDDNHICALTSLLNAMSGKNNKIAF